MRGQECQAAALQMCADQSGDQFDGGAIQCNIGLVEYPQGAPFINQAGERDPGAGVAGIGRSARRPVDSGVP